MQEAVMFNIGPWELALILLVALIVVGPGKLPEVAKSIGKGINEFKKATTGYKKEFQDAMDSIESPVQSYSPEKKIGDHVTTEQQAADQKSNPINDMANNFDAVVLDKQEKTEQ
jgi:sec-independent protein translocase protein TatA